MYATAEKLHGYVFTKTKTNAATARLALLIVGYALATGAVPPDFGAAGLEVFYDRKRLIGSCTETDLPAELTDATERCSLLLAGSRSSRPSAAQCAFVLRN